MFPEPERIAVFRALQLGDLLVAVPALRALRYAFPAARITLVGLPWARSFVARFDHLLDGFIEFPGWPGLPEVAVDVRRLPRFLECVQGESFDLALQLHGSGSIVNELVTLFGARSTAGFYEPGGYRPNGELFTPWPGTGNEIERCLELTNHLRLATRGTELEFPIREADEGEFALLAAKFTLPEAGYVCVHPGSRLPSRRWVPERFAQIADRLASTGYRVVLTGSADDRAATGEVSRTLRSEAIDLTGETSLGALGALLSRARLLVCNDTGVSHVAAALRVPSVVICSGADAVRWAPLDRSLHHVLFHPIACRPCGHEICPVGHPCATAVDVESVWREIERMLAPSALPSTIAIAQASPPRMDPASETSS